MAYLAPWPYPISFQGGPRNEIKNWVKNQVFNESQQKSIASFQKNTILVRIASFDFDEIEKKYFC